MVVKEGVGSNTVEHQQGGGGGSGGAPLLERSILAGSPQLGAEALYGCVWVGNNVLGRDCTDSVRGHAAVQQSRAGGGGGGGTRSPA